jgi:ABC-type bacteriocin/lantibiotic exporter with double-glycine peptidase domain
MANREKSGAGGYWKRTDEKFDAEIVKQLSAASCVSAVGEMLARSFGIEIAQEKIFKKLGNWSNSRELARFLNSVDETGKWLGGHPDNVLKYLTFLLKKRAPFGAIFREKNPRGHAVLIEGLDEKGLVIVKDPFDQTAYKMSVADVFEVLSEVIFKNEESN